MREPSPNRPTAATRNTLNSPRADSNEALTKPKSSSVHKPSQITKSTKSAAQKPVSKTTTTATKTDKTSSPEMSYYVLPLNNDGKPRPLGKGSLISLPVPNPSYHLRLVVSSVSDISRNGKILTNVPKKGDDFDRTKYQAFE